MIPVPGWEISARCREIDPDLFTTEANHGSAVREAKAICGGCPVRRQCLAAALAEEGNKVSSHRNGVRGGKTARERWAMSKQRREAA
ncbi:WhiB family transcriptional regulator [Streptomyces sp. SAJ15]|uniref:WhiB family transcriptional regulator n=1 Tax=Streptomyces sp. SAJ15 TaxID=2011095 RepID=UPI0016430AF1|nr:WhiB family transcriptional regulator [Streptomyces sp. SAJ15]